MSNCKIAMIGHKRIPGREGGIEVAVEELSTRMASDGYKITCYNRKSKNCYKNKKYKNVTIKNVRTIKTKKLDAIVYSFFASIRAAFGNYEIIHYHGIGPSVMLIIPKILKKKIVVTVHGLNYKTPKWNGVGAKVMRAGEKIAAKYADAIIVLSREQQKYILEKYNRRTIYIPNGVDIGEKRITNTVQKWGLKNNDYFLYLSRITPGKGIECLIETYKKIATDKLLVIAGGAGLNKQYFNDIQKLAGGDERIVFTDYVQGEQLNELYSNCFLYIFPSEAEGMPLCLLEALSMDARCLVSDIPENIEIGGKYIQTFKCNSKKDLKEKIDDIIAENITFNGGSREYVLANFSWDTAYKKTIKVYNDLLEKK